MNENQAASRSNKRSLGRLKDRLRGLAPPRLLRPISRDHSRQSSRAPSPVSSRRNVGDAPATTGTSPSTPEIRPGVNTDVQLVAGNNATIPAIKLDSRLDDKVEGRLDDPLDGEKDAKVRTTTGGFRDQDNENNDPETNTADTADSAQEDDMWKIAEAQLRRDEKKGKLLDAYYDILKSKLKEDLEPAGTRERQKQIYDFITSEFNSFHGTSQSGTFSSVLRKAASCVKKAADCVLKAENVISAAAQPCLPASIACAGVMLVVSLCIQAGSQRDVLFKGLDEIPDVIYDLAEHEKLHWADTQEPVFKRSMTNLCSGILEFLARAACHLQKHPVTRILKDMFNQGEWDVLLAAIKNAEARLINHSTVSGWKDVRMIREAQEKDQLAQRTATLSKATAARNEKITAFLKKIHEHAWPDGDSYEFSKDRVKPPEEGTCKWFINHDKFKAWESSGNPNSKFLLLTAYPGCGKSVLSKHLIDTVLSQSKDRTVCYFFFKDDFEHQKSAVGALCTLLHQLLVMSESKGCTLLADSALRRLETMGNESFFGSVCSLWKTFTEAALHTDAGEVVCVLDALDECRTKDRNEIIRAINEFYRTPRNQESSSLKFFLTSRPYGNIIQSQFYVWGHRLPEIRLAGEEDDVANDIAAEIKIVVNKRIDQICNTFHLSKRMTELMKTNLGNTPGRTYLWITLVFDDLLKKTSGINKEYIESFAKNPPKDVDDTYEKILNRSKTQSPGNQDLKRTRNILQMVVAARRPLTLQEMSIALPLTEHEPPYKDLVDEIDTEEGVWNTIRDCCGLLVIRVDDRLYLLHQTVREFLVVTDLNHENQRVQDTPDSGTILPRSYLWKHSIDLTYANSVLAKSCISYLHTNFAKTDNSLLDYSAIYWIDHYHQSGQKCQAAVAKMTRDICVPSEPRAKWTEIHNKYYAIPATGSLLCLASALGLDRAIEEFLHEQNSTGLDLENDVDTNDDYDRTPLSWAADNGHEAVVQLLLATGKADVDSKDYDDQTPLSYAARNGHAAVVKLLLATGTVDVDAEDKHGWTPLSYAARNGYEAVVKLLLSTGKVDVDSEDKHGWTPLSYAARNGHEAVVQLLLATGEADVDWKDYGDRTQLSYAAGNGHEAVVKLLLATGKVDVNSKDKYGRTQLSYAAGNGHEAVVQLLLATGKVDVNSKNYGDRTPLSYAAGDGHEAVVQLLLATGKADVNSKDSDDRTPLSYAARNGHDAVVKLLLAMGKADVNSKDSDDLTPLSYAARNGHEAVVKLLLAMGKADVDSKDKHSQTPLSWAADNGHEAVVQLLLATGKADVDSKDCNDQTPLSYAAEAGHEAVVQLLLATGKVDVNSKNYASRTPLSYAAGNGHDAVVKLLLATGKADVNSKDYNGRTPLSFAADNGHEAVVQLLLVTGKADVDSKDYGDRTPLSRAADNGHEAVVKLLHSIMSLSSQPSPHPPPYNPISLEYTSEYAPSPALRIW